MRRYNPESLEQLLEYLVKLHENYKHVKSIKVDSASNVIRIDLDFGANLAGYDDFELVLVKSRVPEAKEAVAEMLRNTEAGHAPTRAQAERIWSLLNHGAQ